MSQRTTRDYFCLLQTTCATLIKKTKFLFCFPILTLRINLRLKHLISWQTSGFAIDNVAHLTSRDSTHRRHPIALGTVCRTPWNVDRQIFLLLLFFNLDQKLAHRLPVVGMRRRKVDACTRQRGVAPFLLFFWHFFKRVRKPLNQESLRSTDGQIISSLGGPVN